MKMKLLKYNFINFQEESEGDDYDGEGEGEGEELDEVEDEESENEGEEDKEGILQILYFDGICNLSNRRSYFSFPV